MTSPRVIVVGTLLLALLLVVVGVGYPYYKAYTQPKATVTSLDG